MDRETIYFPFFKSPMEVSYSNDENTQGVYGNNNKCHIIILGNGDKVAITDIEHQIIQSVLKDVLADSKFKKGKRFTQ